MPPAPLGSERKIKNIKSKKEKAENLFIILRMVEVKKSKNVIYYAKACEEKRIELLFIPKGYQRE